MKISKVKLLSVMFTGALAFACAPAMADDKKADSADTAKAEEPVKKKKKGPAKKPEYFRWNDAAAIAEAWEQPVLVFIDLEDSKECGRVRSATVGHNLFKAFFSFNMFRLSVFIHTTPQQSHLKSRRFRCLFQQF